MKELYKFAASVKLAIPLMIILAIAMIAGTIVESKFDTVTAQTYIYHHPFFIVLNILIALNIFLATVIRYPFKKSQTGFVITHAGLLMIFGGAISQQLNGIDGYLNVREGFKSNKVSLINDSRRFVLPFDVKLKTFHLTHEEITGALADYESHVIINGHEYEINMNNPLQIDGFYLYQSSYELNPQLGNISIFSVGYDPGRPLKYLGSLFLCLGMAVMYWFKAGIFKVRKHEFEEEKELEKTELELVHE